MKEKISIVKSRRDFAKAQGEDPKTRLETELFLIDFYRGGKGTGDERKEGGKRNFESGGNWQTLKNKIATLRNILEILVKSTPPNTLLWFSVLVQLIPTDIGR